MQWADSKYNNQQSMPEDFNSTFFREYSRTAGSTQGNLNFRLSFKNYSKEFIDPLLRTTSNNWDHFSGHKLANCLEITTLY
jgi:hypothetical protein